jgi:hypothetical protein
LTEACARFGANPVSERVQPRKRLAENAWSRCYFFADDFSASRSQQETRLSRPDTPRKLATVDGFAVRKIGNEIMACYRAAFEAAHANDCRFLTLPSLENRFAALLSGEAAAVQILGTLRQLVAEFSDICVTVLSQNPHVRNNFSLLESTA